MNNEQKDKTDSRVRNAAAALAIEHRQLLMEFCKNPEKSKALHELEEALSAPIPSNKNPAVSVLLEGGVAVSCTLLDGTTLHSNNGYEWSVVETSEVRNDS